MKKPNIYTLLFTGFLTLGLVFTGEGSENTVESDDFDIVIDERIYQMRIYTTYPGRLDDLHERFSNHTVKLFAKHGMVNVGYWVPEDKDDTLIYILSHDSKEAAEKSWEDFRSDPDWLEAYEASRADGPIVSDIESYYMKAVVILDKLTLQSGGK